MDGSLKDLECYFKLMTMNGATSVFHIAIKLNIFQTLSSKPLKANELSERLGYDKNALELILKSLCSIDVVIQDGEEFLLAPVMQFLNSNYQNLSNEYWDHLDQFVKTGAPLHQMDNVAQSEEYYQQQVYSLYWMMRPSAEAAAHMLGIGKTRMGKCVLDLGAGSAIWSMVFARNDPNATITVNDWPAVLDLAKTLIEKEGVASQCSFLPGNYHEIDLKENSYDIAILANVTHLETEEKLIALFKKIRFWLKEKGELIIFDIFQTEEGKATASLYELGLALRTENAKVFSQSELELLLTEAGLKVSGFSHIQTAPNIMGYIVSTK